jgi:hypothetical protein
MPNEQSHPVPGKATVDTSLFEVDTPLGPRPYIPPGPEPAPRPKDDEGNDLPDNPQNPRGKPSLSLPQQATPLTSDQGVLEQAKLYDRSPETVNEIMVSDGLAPDDPENPRGTPDYIVEPQEKNDDEPPHAA